MAAHEADFTAEPSLDDILQVDAWARQQVSEQSAKLTAAPILL